MGTCRRGDMEQGVSGIIPPAKAPTPSPCQRQRPQRWGYSTRQLQEGKLRHGAMLGLVSSRGSALGNWKSCRGRARARRCGWFGEGCGLQGRACEAASAAPARGAYPAARAASSLAPPRFGEHRKPEGWPGGTGHGGTGCRPQPPAPCSQGCSVVRSAVLHQPSAEGKLRHGARSGGIWP